MAAHDQGEGARRMTRTVTPQADQTPKEPEAAPPRLHTGTSDLRALLTRNLRTERHLHRLRRRSSRCSRS